MLCTLLDQADRFSLDRKGLRNILYMSEKKRPGPGSFLPL